MSEPPEVANTPVRRIVLLGGESSGKSTLAAKLADRHRTLWVHEYGRELWEQQKGVMSEQDLLKIAYEQIRREEAELRNSRGFLFCDTSPLTTAGYSLWMFGHVDPKLARLAARSYDGVILCRPDFPFVQDGFRREEAFRHQQHAWYQEQLAALACPILEVGGSVPERIASVESWLASADLCSYGAGNASTLLE